MTYSISGSANQAILKEYGYIRIGTLAELNGASPTAYQNNKASYTKDGVYEKVQEVDDSGNPKVDEAGDPVYNYDNCLYVQLANGSNTADPNFKATTMLRLDSVKIDSKEPYFPSGKNGEDKPIEIKNIKDDTPSTTSFFSAVFGLDQPDDDLEEEFGGGHIKLIPHAKDFAATDYNADGSLKNDAKALDGGIASYKLEAKVLDVTTGLVDDTKAVVSMTIDTNDKKFIDVPEDPYFELNGEEAYWVKLTAIDRAGREKTIERKLYMDDSVAAEPKVEVNSITKNDTGDEVKTKYEGGLLKDENGDEIANWVGKDIQIDLSLTATELADVKSGIDHYEYAAKADIEAFVKGGGKRDEYDGWISLGKKKDASGKDTKDPETMFKTDSSITSMNDEYYFRAVSRAGIAGKESTFVIKMDKQEPKLAVEAEIFDETQNKYVEYTEGTAVKQGIKVTISLPKGETLPVSGVKYYYRGVPNGWTSKAPKSRAATPDLPTDEEIPWIEVKKNEAGKYSFLATDKFSGKYYFRAVNGANVTTTSVNIQTLTANIDIDQPNTPISVEVIDGKGNAYDGKWTNEDLTLTITGGLDTGSTVKYYEYATDRTSTDWKKITANADNEFKLEIDSSQTINANYYFRVIKKEDAVETPYSTTQKAVKIRHDAVIPMFQADPDGVKLTPDYPDIATAYVTLKVQMREANPIEAANASPIAFYSVDGGTTWIAADSKDPKVFTYDFKENTKDIEIKVKDEAGNEATYPTKLEVKNIDKTGPSAPSFPAGFVNGEWKNSKQTIPVTFEPALTGATEKIQYRVQKFDGTDYKEFDVATNAFIDNEVWLEGLENQAQVDIELEENGEYRIIARTIDSMGRYSAESKTTGDVRIDKIAPTLSAIKEVPDKWAASATSFLSALTGNTYFKDHITYTFTGADTGGSGLDKYQYQLVDKDAVGPDPDKWIDAYQGEVNIEEDFSGKLYARAVDYAGNISKVQETVDLINVDATVPLLTVSPEKWGDDYTNGSSLTITAKDAGSGIKDSEVKYTSDYAGTEVFPNKSLFLDATGSAVLNNLPGGSYTITFTTEDKSGHSVTVDYPVLVDKEEPEIAIVDSNKSGIVKEKEVSIEVKNTISGDAKVTATLGGKELTLKKTDKAGTELTEGNVTVYTAKITGNGKLEATATSPSLHNGTNATATASTTISNVYNVDPQIKVEAFVGKSEKNDKYKVGQWTSEHIEIVLTNTEDAIQANQLTFQYKEFDKDGLELTHDWTNTEDFDPLDKTNVNGKFSVYKNGVRTFKFRVVMLDPTDPTKEPILKSDEEEITIMQDIVQPAAPILEIPNAGDYEQTKWYHGAQTLKVDFTPVEGSSGQWIEYLDSADKSGKWNKVTSANAAGKYEIKVTGDKEHIITIRSNDYFGRASAKTAPAYVNIDTATPDFDVDIKYTSANATLKLITETKEGNSTIGNSGIYKATIQKKDDAGALVDATEKVIYGKSIVLDKDNFGNGTYQVTLTTNSGKTVQKDIKVDGISLPKPMISVTANEMANDGTLGDAYTSGTWITGPKVNLHVDVTNTAIAGTNFTYEYQEDGDNTWTLFSKDGKDNDLEVSGAGKHAVNIRAVNASGTTSEVYHFNVWIDDDWDNTFSIKDEANYVAANWYNKTQTIESSFKQDLNGCKEWIEYSEDGGTTWTHNSRNTYEVSTTGKHVVQVRKNDEMGSGNAETGTTINVNVDKEPIKNFKVQIDKNSYSSFLSTITFGIYHNEEKEAEITGNFGISEADEIYYQIVEDPADYVNAYAKDASDAGWQPYTVGSPIPLANNFKGFVYAKGKDKAGNTSNIIRTDGVVIDTIAPTIEIDDNKGDWITKNEVGVTVSDYADNATSTIGNASGIKSIDYETKEANPIEGTIELDGTTTMITGLHDGEYDVYVSGSDKAGNLGGDTKTIKVDTKKPVLEIEGYNELSLASENNLTLNATVGASGIKSLTMHAVLPDGSTLDETLTGPNYAYKAVKNGTYTFTLTNNADAEAKEVLVVNNITDDLGDIMGLDIKTKDLKGDVIDYLNAEETAVTTAAPQWSANDIVFSSHGTTKFKASVDGGQFTDFNADGTFTVRSEGIHTVKIKNYSNPTTRTFLVKIDKREVQDIKIVDERKYTADKWYTGDNRVIQATFTPEDTGIDEWLEYYDASQAKWVKGDSVILNQEGRFTVKFRGNDELNRPTAEKSVIVNIDKTAPTDLKIKLEKSKAKEFINYLFPNTFDETVDVTIHANGDISGNQLIEYLLVNEEAGDTYNDLIGWETYTTSFNIPDGFKGKVYARATDNAGNRTINAVTEDGIVVDTKTPIVTFQTNPMADWTKENTVRATIDPTLSGLQSAWYTITKNGIVTKYDIDLKDIDASNNITLKDLPNGKYVIELSAKNKAGKVGDATLDSVMIETRGPILNVEADLEKKASSIPVTVDVDMSSLHTTLKSLTWKSAGTSEQDILADKKFTINSNGVYKITATTSDDVVVDKLLVVTNITNVSSEIGVNAYESENNSNVYTGGNTWSAKDITIEVRDTIGKVPTADLMMEMRITDLKDDTSSAWTVMEADKTDPALYKTAASAEGSYVYEFRGSYEGVAGSIRAFQVNIDRSEPKKPVFTEDTLKKYDNDNWHNDYDAEVEVELDATDGCDEWLEYNIDGATDYEGKLLWTPTLNQKADKIKVVDDKDHIVQIRTSDRLERHSEINEIHVKLDSTRPTDFYIKEGDNKYQDFLDKLTGGNFYKESKTIEIGGNFKISGVEKIEYQIVKDEKDFSAANAWTKVNVAKGEEFGTFQLLPGTKGIIYARGVDKAGNETGIIRTDLITIDNSAPLLIVPDDATVWSADTTMKIKVKDEQSGLKSVTYYSEDPAQSGEVTLSDVVDADGYREGIITNLKDGRYLLDVVATNGAGETQTLKPLVMIDTVTPNLKVEGETSKPQTSTTLDLIPIVGGSGLEEIQQLKQEADGSFTVIETISAIEGQEKYPYEFIENGIYYFRVVNGAGVASDPVTEIKIGNIKSDKPVIVFRTDNGYDPSTWSGKAVTLEVNTNTNAELSYRKKGDTDYINASNVYYQNLKFNKTGIYTYEFKSVFKGTGGAPDIETIESYTVKVDLEAPKKPSIANIDEFSEWYKLVDDGAGNVKGKDVTLIRDTSDYVNGADVTKYGDGSKETAYYHIDGDNDAGTGEPNWIEMKSDTININKEGENVVTFKIIDEVAGHVTMSDPVHVKIYKNDPRITLTDITKPVKSYKLGILIDGMIDADEQIKSLSIERVGSDTVSIQVEQDQRKYSYPINKNGTYIVRVVMENGGSAEMPLNVTNIIEEDPILDITATYDNGGTATNYEFGKWATGEVTLSAVDPKATPNLEIKYRSKVKDGTWSGWNTYNTSLKENTTGTTIYQFKTVLTVGADNYETVMDETYAVKVDTTPPAEVIINEYDTYKSDTTWVSDPVNLTTRFIPDTAGAKEWVEYSTDKGKTWIKKSSVMISEAGKNEIWFRSADEAGRVTVAKDYKVYVNIDTTSAGNVAMTIGGDVVPAGNPNNISFDKFYKKGDQITLKLMKDATTEDTTGKLYYQLAKDRDAVKNDAGAWKLYTGAFDIPDNFRGSIYAYGENQSGKKTEVIRSNGFTLDSEAPKIQKPNADMTDWNKSNKLDVEITDNLSGLDATKVTYATYADDTTTTPIKAETVLTLKDGKGSITLDDGDYYVEIKASDIAGNDATPVRVRVKIDAEQTGFTLAQTNKGDHATITANITKTPVSGIQGVYIRGNGSSWALIDATAPITTASFDVYKNGDYEVKVVNNAGRDSEIKTINVTGIVNDLPDYIVKTTDGFEFGDFWYKELTIWLEAPDADAIYYSTNGKAGPWKAYTDKIEISETSAYQYTFKLVKGDKELITLPYDTRVIINQAVGKAKVRNAAYYMRSVFRAFSDEPVEVEEKQKEEWLTTGARITLTTSSSTAPGYKAGTYIQVLEADKDGNGIGYNDRNFTLVDDDDPTYTFQNEGRYVVYKFYAFYVEGEEDHWSEPKEIEKDTYNIDGTAPYELKLSAEIDGSTTILNNLTGGLFFKEPITIIPQGSDSLSGIDHYEFQSVGCVGDACDAVVPSDSKWDSKEDFIVPQDFEGIVYVRAVDAAQPEGNYLEKSLRLSIKDDITTYKILEDISNWTNTTDLNIEVTPSTNGLQELNYKVFDEGKEDEVSFINLPSTDTENKLFTIRNIPEGIYNLKVVPVETGGISINRGVHELKVDRTKPVVTMELKQSNEDAVSKVMNTLTLNKFYKPGLIVSASATDMAGTMTNDPKTVKIEYRLNGGEWSLYTSELKFNDEDVLNISFRAIDQAGNISDTVTQDGIAIDATAPSFEGAGNNVTYWLPRTVSVKDTLSGVDTVKLNDKRVSSTVLVKDYGTSRIEAADRSGNESAIAFTIKGLNDIKDEDITNDLIKEIEKEFEEQKPGYDAELTDKIQKEIDDLKDRNQDTSTPGNDGQGDHDGTNQNPSGDGNGSNGGSQTPGTDGTNGGNGTNGNGSGNDGTGTNGSGNNGNGSSGTTNTGSNSGTGQSSGVMRTGTTQTAASGVKTGDYTSILAFLALGLLSAMLAVAVKLKQRLNALQNR